MKSKKTWLIVVGVVILIILIGSGWVYNIVKENGKLASNNELATLQTTFVQQYGNQATIKQLVSPDKVYAALWSDGDGISHVSWNIGGLWVSVWSGSPPNTTPTPAPTP